MAPVAIRAGRRVLIARRHRTPVNAQLVRFHGTRKRNLVLGKKAGVRVTRAASLRQIFLRYRRARILRHQDLVHRAVASLARRRLRVAIFCSLGVDAGSESFHLVVMASRAELRSKSRSRQRFMRRPVATIACLRPQQRMHALRHIGGLLRMAGGAIHFRNSRGVRILLDIRMAIGAIQYRVCARLVFRFVDVEAMAGF